MPEREQPITERPFMPGYGIEAGPTGLLPWSWAERQLIESRHVWVATNDEDGSPRLAVVWGVWLDGVLYFSTGRSSRKARNLAADPRCAITPGDGDEALSLKGTARRVTDWEAIATVERGFVAKYGEGFPDAENDPLYALDLVTAYGVREAAFTASATRWRFTD
jgi:general stress protein 26